MMGFKKMNKGLRNFYIYFGLQFFFSDQTPYLSISPLLNL